MPMASMVPLTPCPEALTVKVMALLPRFLRASTSLASEVWARDNDSPAVLSSTAVSFDRAVSLMASSMSFSVILRMSYGLSMVKLQLPPPSIARLVLSEETMVISKTPLPLPMAGSNGTSGS